MKRALVVVLLAGTMVACGIPNLKPFSDATTQMATVLKQGFDRTRLTLAGATETARDDQAFIESVKKLDDNWKPTRKALSSVVAYSDSLVAIAEAGKKGNETTAKVTGALEELAASVGVLPVAGAAEVINKVGAKIIEIKAANDIRKAVNKAGEAVDIVAEVLVRNFEDLRSIHNAAAAAWESRVLERSSIEINYYNSLTQEVRRLEYLLTLVSDYQSAPAQFGWRAARARAEKNEPLAQKLLGSITQFQADQLTALRALDAAFPTAEAADAAAKVETRQQQLLAQITAQRREITALEPSYRQASADLAVVREARITGDQLLQRSGEAIIAWQKAHRSLQAVATGAQARPSVADLLSIIGEISSLTD